MTAAVLFDVDGTLVDTNYLHAVCWWQSFRRFGYDVAMRDLHRAIGMGSDKLVDAVLPEPGIVPVQGGFDRVQLPLFMTGDQNWRSRRRGRRPGSGTT